MEVNTTSLPLSKVTTDGLRPAVRSERALAPLLVVCAFLLIGLALRLYHLDYQSLWGDEEFAVRISREPWSGLLPLLTTGEPHPPLYFALLHVWRVVAGDNDFSLRLLSTFFSVAAIAATYGIGWRLAGRRCAMAAALLAAANPFQIWYAQEVRMYAMLAALSALSVLTFVDALQTNRKARWALYAGITILALYTHYHAVFIVLVEDVIAGVMLLRDRRIARSWLASQFVLLAIFAPWAFAVQGLLRSWAGGQHLIGSPWMPPPDIGSVITLSFSRLTLGISLPADWATPATTVTAVIAASALAFLLRRNALGGMSLVIYVLVPHLAVWLTGTLVNRSMFYERYLIGVSPALYILLAYGAGWSGKRRMVTISGLVVLLIASALSLNNHYFNGRLQKDDLRGLARYIDARARDGDLVVASITRSGLYGRYAAVSLPVYVLPPGAQPSTIGDALSAATAGYKRIWFLPYAYDELDVAVGRWLGQNGYPAGERWFNTARLEAAGLPQRSISTGGFPRLQEGGANFGGRVQLSSFGVSGQSFQPGDIIGVALEWGKGAAELRDVKASLRLLDARGNTRAQVDRPVAGAAGGKPEDAMRNNLGLAVPVDTPPAGYRLEMRLYETTAGGHDLAIVDERGGGTGTVLKLGEIQVGRAQRPAAVTALEPANPASVSFGPAMRLAGYELPGETWRAGDRVAIALHWQATQPDGKEYRPVLRLIGGNGTEAARYVASARTLPVSEWRPGELIGEIDNWRLPPGLAPGLYTVALGVESHDGQAVSSPDGEQLFTMGRVRIEGRAGYAPPAAPQHAVAYNVGKFAKLEGYDLSGTTARPGATIALTLHWKAIDESEESYKVFTHLLSKDEQVWGQQDSFPCQGNCPTSGWASSEQLADQYSLTLRNDAPPGTYGIEVGMYNPVDGKRLEVTDQSGRPVGDRIVIAEVTVQ